MWYPYVLNAEGLPETNKMWCSVSFFRVQRCSSATTNRSAQWPAG